MGQVIQLRERVPLTKSIVARRMHKERERAMAHAQMMMFGAVFTTGIMMLGLAILGVVN